MRYVLLLLLSVLPQLASALVFDGRQEQIPLGREVSVFEDVRGDATISQVTSPALADSFHRQQRDTLNAGYSRSAFWLRLDLEYRPAPDVELQNWLLELAYPPLDHLDLYLPDGRGGYYLARRTGDALPFASREYRQSGYLFDLPLQAGTPLRVYLRLESQGSIQAPLTLWSGKAFLEAQPANIYVLGIIYGVLLAMLAYNLFIFLSVRDTSYLYYICYIASFGLYQVSVNGAGIEYLWPDNPWWANASTPFLIGSAVLFGSQFARSFLQTRRHGPWTDRLLLALVLCGGLTMLLSLTVSYATALRLATLLALLFTVAIFGVGIVSWMRGLRVARYFIIAWSAFLGGGLINTLMVLGYLPNLFITMYASQIGSALEVALLSLALADRINAMREERARILQDASERLESLNRELANSNRLKDEFLATVTHELRTPMNGVIGSLELMQTLPMEAEAQQYQETATHSAREMMRMIGDILALTELQSGRLYPRREPFSLRALFDGLAAQFGARAAGKGVAFILDVEPRLPDVYEGDAAKLGQCLGYLLDNAVKFTRAGEVRLVVRRAPGQPAGDTLLIEVCDTGTGFPMVDDDSLYATFRQLDGSMTRQYGGLGIGLALCRQLAELLGGRLGHESEVGQGSVFRLEIPLTRSTPTGGAAPRPVVHGEPLRRPCECRVLVVEDDPINQLVTRGMLLKLGYQVLAADDGAGALDTLRRERVDAVLLDCQMPVMDGFATCRALRTLPGGADLPVLAITAHSHSGDREHCLAAGMSDYLAKPIKFDELQRLLHDWVLCRPPRYAKSADPLC